MAPEEIASRVQGVGLAGQEVLAGNFGQKFVDGGPRTDVAPADFGGNYEDGRSAGLTRGGFQNGVVDRNIFKFRVNRAQLALVAAFADAFGKLFESGEGFWQIFVESFEESGGAPEKHSSVPVIIAGAGVHFRDGERGLFREAADGIHRKTLGIKGVAHALDVAETGFG